MIRRTGGHLFSLGAEGFTGPALIAGHAVGIAGHASERMPVRKAFAQELVIQTVVLQRE
jgi:hypothetical protein